MEAKVQLFQMQNYLFPLMSVAVFALLHFYIYKALLKSFATTTLFKVFWLVFIWFNFFGCAVYFALLHKDPSSQALFLLLSLSIGVAFCLTIITLIYQICSLFIYTIKDKSKRATMRYNLKRACGILAIVFIIIGLIGGAKEPVVYEVPFVINGLKQPLKAVQLSDVHIGGLMDSTRVRSIVERVNALQPDIIFLTGDIIDSKLSLVESAVNELGNLQAQYGVYYALGNHEYFHDLQNIIAKLQGLGFHLLINESETIHAGSNEIVIAGIADLVGTREAFTPYNLPPKLKETLELSHCPQNAMHEANQCAPIILLSHQPKIIEEFLTLEKQHPELTQNVALILSGHTHGGQIFPFSLLVLLQQPYLKGLAKINQNTSLYINQGTGYWGPPMRVLSESEITLFHFLPKEQQ